MHTELHAAVDASSTCQRLSAQVCRKSCLRSIAFITVWLLLIIRQQFQFDVSNSFTLCLRSKCTYGKVDGLTNAQIRAQLDALAAEDAAVKYSQYEGSPVLQKVLGKRIHFSVHDAEDDRDDNDTALDSSIHQFYSGSSSHDHKTPLKSMPVAPQSDKTNAQLNMMQQLL